MESSYLILLLIFFGVLLFFIYFRVIMQGYRKMQTSQLFQRRQHVRILYGYSVERIRQQEPELMVHIRQLITTIGIGETIGYVESAAGLPHDIAELLVCSEANAPTTRQPQPLQQPHPGPTPR